MGYSSDWSSVGRGLPLWARVRDSSIFIALSLLTAYVVYVVAEEVLHVSGVLAVVSYGLYRGWRDPRIFPDASTRIRNISFWQVLVFLLESMLFVLIGQQLPAILDGLGEYSAWELPALRRARLCDAHHGAFCLVLHRALSQPGL